jgi:hypothetical protein
MDRKAFQWDGSQVGEIGWTAHLTRNRTRLRRAERGPVSDSSGRRFFVRIDIEKNIFATPCGEKNGDLH